jgi:DNA-binding Lrp family transcriptional regulator
MRPPPLDLISLLRLRGPVKAARLASVLGISQSTLSRRLRALGDDLVVRGVGRRTRYSLRRALRGRTAPLPLFAVDTAGRGSQIGVLDCIAPAGTALAFHAPFPWPLLGDMRDGWFEGLPYPIADMRPQGFLGRSFAKQHARLLGVPAQPEAWSDDDVINALSVAGGDLPGDLILGEGAYQQFLEAQGAGATRFLAEEALAGDYPRLAARALSEGSGESSLAGEFPKFVAARRIGQSFAHVLVKFSGDDHSPAVRRWSDLLVCEHLAAEALRADLRVGAASTRCLRSGGRTFLEVERFDRHGPHGRSPVCTLESVRAALIGAPLPWPQAAARLRDEGLLSGDDAASVARLYWFGRLIGNTDMHDGNLAFRPGLRLAPAYDMLPMLYAPSRGGELPERRYDPPLPLPAEADAWREAARGARAFWLRCEADARISDGFRSICGRNAEALARTIGAA